MMKKKDGSKSRTTRAGVPPRPNVIFIWCDNLGWGDLSIYGCPYYKTPHLDKLARQGTRFVNAYACAPMCTPSRVGFFTGRYPGRIPIGIRETLGLPHIEGDRIGLPPEHPTVSSLLRDAGYNTALVGKWHLGYLPTYSPLKSGFDEYFGFKTGSINNFTHVDAVGAPDLWDNDEPIKREGYITDLLTEHAVEFIRKPRNAPFFLCLFHAAPHWPWMGPRDKYLSDEIAGHDSHRTWMETGTAENYVEVMRSLDAGVGSVLQALDKAKLARNTVVIFASDQGGDEMAYLSHLRRGRLHEGGIRVPLIVRWPRIVRSGQVTKQVATGLDITATILSAARVKPHPRFPLDGHDLLPILSGKRKLYPRELFWRHAGNPRPGIPAQRAMRMGDWKYLKVHKNEFLYNLANDEGETRDLKNKFKTKLAELRGKHRKWETDMLPYDKEKSRNFKRLLFE